MRAIRALKTIVFVGCGYEGLADPNFGRLLDWARQAFRKSQAEHFLLCRERDLGDLRLRIQDSGILPVVYDRPDEDETDEGPDKDQTDASGFDKLPGFLRGLHPRARVLPFWRAFARPGTEVHICVPQVKVDGEFTNLTSEDDLASELKSDLESIGYSPRIHHSTAWEDTCDAQMEADNADDWLGNHDLVVLGSVHNSRVAGRVASQLLEAKDGLSGKPPPKETMQTYRQRFHQEWIDFLKKCFRVEDFPNIKDAPAEFPPDKGGDGNEYYTTWAVVLQTENPYGKGQIRRKALLAVGGHASGCYAALRREAQTSLTDALGRSTIGGEFAALFDVKVRPASRMKELFRARVESKEIDDLDRKRRGDSLPQAFESESYGLSHQATLSVVTKGNEWKIKDENRTYLLRRLAGDQMLRVGSIEARWPDEVKYIRLKHLFSAGLVGPKPRELDDKMKEWIAVGDSIAR
jgi:hypothetical protein